MFNSRLIEDTIHETIGNIFRVPHHGRPVTCFEMAGMPSEVVNSVCSVLARLAFDLALWSEGRLKLLLLCEEAHRYMPADPRLGFAPTRHALSRIAKEGRKYGCYLGVVTQRPGELDPTILSQCSTFFAMRLANEQDQAIIRSAIANSSASTLAFLSSMGQREAIAFGEGVATTMRLKFEKLAENLIPGTGQARAGRVLAGRQRRRSRGNRRTAAQRAEAAAADGLRRSGGFRPPGRRSRLPQAGQPPSASSPTTISTCATASSPQPSACARRTISLHQFSGTADLPTSRVERSRLRPRWPAWVNPVREFVRLS